MKNNSISTITWLIIISFLLVPLCVSVISTIHVISFFEISNSFPLAVSLAISFEIGALSALAGLVAMNKINKNVVWFIFILLTLFQILGNTYFSYDVITNKMIDNPNLIKNWAELFGLIEEDPIMIKRIIAILSGAVLPIVSLSFLDLLVDYIRKTFGIEENNVQEKKIEIEQEIIKDNKQIETINKNEENSESKLDDIVLDGKIEKHEEEDFHKILEEKKKRLDDMREPNMDMLSVLYDDGKIKSGEELPSYNDFVSKLEKDKYSQKEINLFLTLCNYLEIFKVSYNQKTALKSYDEAKEILSNYLTIN